MECVLLIVSTGKSLLLPENADARWGGHEWPLQTGECPHTSAQQLSDQLGLQGYTLEQVGALSVYHIPTRCEHVPVLAWEHLPIAQRHRHLHLYFASPRVAVDRHVLRESVPYHSLAPMTAHWLPFILAGSAVHAQIAKNVRGTVLGTHVRVKQPQKVSTTPVPTSAVT